MKIRTITQSSTLFAIMDKLDLIEERNILAIQYSKGRTERTSELYIDECAALIKDLQLLANQSRDRQRKRMISMCWELGWVENVGTGKKADIIRLDNWVRKYGYLNEQGKGLNDYSDKELPRLVTQFSSMYRKEMMK